MVVSHTTFSGGVTNAGTIGAGGISVSSSTFLSGGIVDAGVISGGIRVDGHSRILASSATAIAVINTTTLGGSISNAGILSATANAVLVSAVTAFAGGITNSGSISCRTAIDVAATSSFAGGIVNVAGGTIAASRVGVRSGCHGFRRRHRQPGRRNHRRQHDSGSGRKRQHLQRRHPQCRRDLGRPRRHPVAAVARPGNSIT